MPPASIARAKAAERSPSIAVGRRILLDELTRGRLRAVDLAGGEVVVLRIPASAPGATPVVRVLGDGSRGLPAS